MPIVTFRCHQVIRLKIQLQHTAKQPPSSARQPTASHSPPSFHAFSLAIHASGIQPKAQPNQHVCVPPSAFQRRAGCHLRLHRGAKSTRTSRSSGGGSILSTKKHRLRECPTCSRLGASIPLQGPLHRSGGKETHQAHGPPTD